MKRIFAAFLAALMVLGALPCAAFGADTVSVSDKAAFLDAAADPGITTLVLTADIDLRGSGVVDLSGKTLMLGGNTLTSDGSVPFVGTGFSIQNGIIDADGAGYALLLGDYGGTRRVVVEGVTFKGGIALNGAKNVTLADLYVNANSYFAVTVNESSSVTIDSGVYKGGSEGIISIEESGAVTINDGTFYSAGNPLAYGGTMFNPFIAGGSYDTDPTAMLPVTSGVIKEGDVYTVHAHVLQKQDEVKATLTTDGQAEHYACLVCGALYADPDCKQPLAEEDVFVPASIAMNNTTAILSTSALADSTDQNNVTLDLSRTSVKVEAFEADVSDLRDLAEGDKVLTVKTGAGTVCLQKKVMYYVANQSAGAQLATFTLKEAGDAYFNSAMQKSAKQYDIVSATVFGINCGDKSLDTLQSGDVQLQLPVPSEEGILPSAYRVYRLGEDGTATQMQSEYADNALQFNTDQSGIYIVTRGGEIEGQKDGGNTLWIIAIIVLCVGGAMYLIYREYYKKQMKH